MNDSDIETQVAEETETLIADTQAPLKKRDIIGPQGAVNMMQRGGLSGLVPFDPMRGGMKLENLQHLLEMGKVMATTDIFVRPWLRGNVGGCIGLLMLADEWQMSFYALANNSYVVKNKAGEMQLAFESKLIHALIERRAPLQRRLRPTWNGSGAELTCTITGQLIGEDEPFVWTTPKLGDINPKNSPEWVNNPKKQIFYHATRDWGRIYVPDVMMGVYSRDEFDAEVQRIASPEENSVLARIAAARASAPEPERDGFDEQGIARALNTGRHDHEEQKPAQPEPPAQERSEQSGEPQEGQESGTRSRKPRKPRSEAPKQEEPPPASDTAPKGAPPEPTDNDSYVAYANHWIEAVQSDAQADNAEARWDGERELRAKCKVTIASRKSLESKLKDRCKEARNG